VSRRPPHVGLTPLSRPGKSPSGLRNGWGQTSNTNIHLRPNSEPLPDLKQPWKIAKKKEDSRKPQIPMGSFRLTQKPILREVSRFLQKSGIVYVDNVYERAKQCIMDGNDAKLKQALTGMDINMQDPKDYNTLLHWVVAYNEIEMARYLLQRGIIQLKNGLGLSPLDLALQAYNSGDYSFWEIKNLLSGKDIQFLKE